MTDQSIPQKKTRSVNLATAVLLILPLILLGGVIAIFLKNSGGIASRFARPGGSLNHRANRAQAGQH